MRAPKAFTLTATALLFLLPAIPIRANQPIRTLGNDSLGETVKQFQIHHPKATCGTTTSLDINPQTLVQSENMDDAHCCLNDSASLTEFSKFPILNLDDCALHALFWKGKLYELSYMLDIRSIRAVLDHFLKLYGPATRMLKDPEDATQLTLVDWWQGMTILWLRTATINEDAFAKYSLRKAGGLPLHVVYVELWVVHL